MKNLFAKKMMAFAVFALGIGGAFVTMSMQKTSEKLLPEIGWATNAQGVPCSQQVQCDNSGSTMCRVSYPSGNIAHRKVGSTCLQPLFRP